MRIRVYLDRTDHLWRVAGVQANGAMPAVVAARVQEHRRGPGWLTWREAMACADRMATRSRRQAWLRTEYASGVTQAPL